jgi:hypothetical protein
VYSQVLKMDMQLLTNSSILLEDFRVMSTIDNHDVLASWCSSRRDAQSSSKPKYIPTHQNFDWLYLHEWRQHWMVMYGWNIGIIHHWIDIPYTVHQLLGRSCKCTLRTTVRLPRDLILFYQRDHGQSARLVSFCLEICCSQNMFGEKFTAST